MENNNDGNGNFYRLIAYMMSQSLWIDDPTVLKMIIEYTFKNAKQLNDYDFLELFAENDTTIRIYMKTRNKDLLEFIIKNLGGFDKNQFSEEFMDIVVKNIDRDSYLDMMTVPITPNLSLKEKVWRDKHNALVTKKYDDAVKRRVADVSLGLGYAQLDNQVQSIIPSLVLQEIANQSVDFSGMPAQEVYNIIKHINEGTTNKTVRLGQPSNFADAKDEFDDDDVIEI